MSDPIEKLEQSCNLLGAKCEELVKERRDKHIGDIEFVNKYFGIIADMPKDEKRQEIVSNLEDFLKQENKLVDTTWLK